MAGTHRVVRIQRSLGIRAAAKAVGRDGCGWGCGGGGLGRRGLRGGLGRRRFRGGLGRGALGLRPVCLLVLLPPGAQIKYGSGDGGALIRGCVVGCGRSQVSTCTGGGHPARDSACGRVFGRRTRCIDWARACWIRDPNCRRAHRPAECPGRAVACWCSPARTHGTKVAASRSATGRKR